jgi:hypothetical protein
MRKYVIPIIVGSAMLLTGAAKAENPREPENIQYTLPDSLAAASLTKQLDVFVKKYGTVSGIYIDDKIYYVREIELAGSYLLQSFEDKIDGRQVSYLAIIKLGVNCFYFGDIGKDGKVDIFTKKRSGISQDFASDAIMSVPKFAATGNKADLIEGLELTNGKAEQAYIKAALEIMNLPEFKSGPKDDNVK